MSLFNETMMNIFENFLPHEKVTCSDNDSSWMKTQIKTIVEEKDISSLETSHEKISTSENPENVQTKLKNLTEVSKAVYYKKSSKNLWDSHLIPKCYWSLIK